jgi:hypothetical protein
MASKVLRGLISEGCGDAKNWGIEDIRRATIREDLHNGTINVKLDTPHCLRVDYRLDRKDRSDRRDEDLCFEKCWLITPTMKVEALIARTSTNYWTDAVLELMTKWVDGLKVGDSVDVEVWVD